MKVLRAFIVIGISVLALLVWGPPMVAQYATAYTGFHVPIGTIPGSVAATVDTGSPAYNAGVRNGDVVRCLNLHDSGFLYPTFQSPVYSAVPIRGCVIRNGIIRPVTITARPGPAVRSLYGSWAFAFVRLASFIVFLIVSCMLVLLRPNLTTWLLFATSISSGPYAAGTDGLLSWSPPAYYAMELPSVLAIAVGSVFLLLFTIVVPDASLPKGWRSALFAAVCAVGGAFAILRTYDFFHQTSMVTIDGDPVTRAFLRSCTYCVIVVLFVRLLTMRRHERARFGWVAFGIAVGVLANDLRNQVSDDVISNTAGLFTVVMPLCLMYAILRRHVIDVRFVISRTVVYGIITTLVVCIIGVVDWATSAYLSQMRVALAIDAVVTIGLGLVLHRTYGVMENMVDFLIYRQKHEAESYLKRLAKTLLRADREETVERALVDDPYDKLDLAMAALFRRTGDIYQLAGAAGWDAAHAIAFEHDHDIVRFLAAERTRLPIRDLREHVAAEFVESGAVPALAVPLFEGDDLRAFALYGLHRDGTKLDPDEVETLETLCDTAAQAYVRIENVRFRKAAQLEAVSFST